MENELIGRVAEENRCNGQNSNDPDRAGQVDARLNLGRVLHAVGDADVLRAVTTRLYS